MMLDLTGLKAHEFIETAERMKDYMLRVMIRCRGEDEHGPHERAIMMAHITCKLLQFSYKGKTPCWHIIYDAEQMIENLVKPGRKA